MQAVNNSSTTLVKSARFQGLARVFGLPPRPLHHWAKYNLTLTLQLPVCNHVTFRPNDGQLNKKLYTIFLSIRLFSPKTKAQENLSTHDNGLLVVMTKSGRLFLKMTCPLPFNHCHLFCLFNQRKIPSHFPVVITKNIGSMHNSRHGHSTILL